MFQENLEGFEVLFKEMISTPYSVYSKPVEFKREFFLRKSNGWTRELVEEILEKIKGKN